MNYQKKQIPLSPDSGCHVTTSTATLPGFADYNLFWDNPVAILVLPARSFRVASANRAATQLFDCDLGSLTRWDLSDWLDPAALESIEMALWPSSGASPTAIDAVQLLQMHKDQPVKLVATSLTSYGSTGTEFWALFCDRRRAEDEGPDAATAQRTPLANFLSSMPVPAWILNSTGGYLLQNELSKTLPRCQNLNGNSCELPRMLEVGCGLAPGNPEKNWFHLHAEVQASGTPRETQVDLGQCGIWRIVLFPVRHSTDPLLVGGTAFNVTEQVLAQRKTETYLAQLREQAKEMQNLREAERQDIARDIHDNLGQEVTLLRLEAARLRRDALATGGVPPTLIEQMASIEHQIAVVTRATRRISFDLRPDVVHTVGLADAAHNLVLELRRRMGIRGQLELDCKWINPPTEMAVHMYRCLQEALNNMAKHSKADKFVVRLLLTDNVYWLEIMDNGVGLPREFSTGLKPDTPISSRGLRGLYERAAIYNGEVVLGTRPEYEGSLIRIKFPAPPNKDPQ